jgi:hypothetical protein
MLTMREFTVTITVINPLYMVELGLAPAMERKTMTIQGYTLEDAKRRAGIS